MPDFRTLDDIHWDWGEPDTSVTLVFGGDGEDGGAPDGPGGLQADMPPGVAVGLLLPAVNSCRECARSTEDQQTVQFDFIFGDDDGTGATAAWELENVVITSYQTSGSAGSDTMIFEIDATDLSVPELRDEIAATLETIFVDDMM